MQESSMPHYAGESRRDNSTAGDLRQQLPFAALAAFVVSLILHTAVVLALTIWGIQGCGDGSMLAIEGESRLVGIYVKQPDNEVDKTDQKTDSSETELQPQNVTDSLSTSPDLKVSDQPPVELKLPNSVTRRLGPGKAAPLYSPADIGDVVQPNFRRPVSNPAAGLGPGEVSFFNARDKGTRIVFVIDTSGSMYGKPIQVALSELSASVQSLQLNQLFEVVFYGSTSRTLNLKISGHKEGELYRAADYVKTRALQEIARVFPDGGTNHKAALVKALNLNPEIVYLLTDGQAIRPREIHRLNKKGVRIHCIKFGEGPDLSGDSFLEKLATQSGGTYRYLDVKKF
ncbi:MAG: VWA domain-containing protein [Planctomycetes bacterium]|nr:VWA domain-containing protein [Planctomycetota bacterium]